jgi:hypothetical protein
MLTEVSPLTEDLVQQCNDDRTKDFTLALMDFIKWDDKQSKTGSVTDLTGSSSSEQSSLLGSGTVDSETLEPSSPVSSHEQSGFEYYVWPCFVLNLITDQTGWAQWRKKVERGDLTSSRSDSASVYTSISAAHSSSSQADVVATMPSDSHIEPNAHTTRVAVQSAKRSKPREKPPTRRKLYFDALCADRILELEKLENEDRSSRNDTDPET